MNIFPKNKIYFFQKMNQNHVNPFPRSKNQLAEKKVVIYG